jgi:hypothetical protein
MSIKKIFRCTLIPMLSALVIIVGVLGLCVIVLSSPYDIPTHVPDALTLLCEHSQNPHIIQVRVLLALHFLANELFSLALI